jgi:hypothetical protein
MQSFIIPQDDSAPSELPNMFALRLLRLHSESLEKRGGRCGSIATHGKTLGKPWESGENHRKTLGKPPRMGNTMMNQP